MCSSPAKTKEKVQRVHGRGWSISNKETEHQPFINQFNSTQAVNQRATNR